MFLLLSYKIYVIIWCHPFVTSGMISILNINWELLVYVLWINCYSLNTNFLSIGWYYQTTKICVPRKLYITGDAISKYQNDKIEVNKHLIFCQSMKIDTNENNWTHSIWKILYTSVAVYYHMYVTSKLW